MTDQELLARATVLQKEARRVVISLGLKDILGSISEPEIVGNVKSGLMVAPDITLRTLLTYPKMF